MDKLEFVNATDAIWREIGENAIINGMRRMGYHSHDYLFPKAFVFEALAGPADVRESFMADLTVIRDYVRNNGGK